MNLEDFIFVSEMLREEVFVLSDLGTESEWDSGICCDMDG